MNDVDYVGLPSPAYCKTIRRGYEQWGLPFIDLERAVAEVKNRLYHLGITSFEPDGLKRLRPACGRRPTAPGSPRRARSLSDPGCQKTGRVRDP